jgi:hypothetical protein
MKQSLNENEKIGSIQMSPSSELVFYLWRYRNEYYGVIRKFLKVKGYEGPTKSGVTLKLAHIRPLVDKLQELVCMYPKISYGKVWEIERRKTTKLAIQIIKDKESEDFLDIREYIISNNYEGWSKKGIRIRFNQIPEVLSLLRDMAERLEKQISSGSTTPSTRIRKRDIDEYLKKIQVAKQTEIEEEFKWLFSKGFYNLVVTLGEKLPEEKRTKIIKGFILAAKAKL